MIRVTRAGGRCFVSVSRITCCAQCYRADEAACPAARLRLRLELLGAPAWLLDDKHLATAVVTTGRANVMHNVRLSAGVAVHEDRNVFQKVMPAPVALAVAGDSLLWQCAHGCPFPSLQRHPAPNPSKLLRVVLQQVCQRRKSIIDRSVFTGFCVSTNFQHIWARTVRSTRRPHRQ